MNEVDKAERSQAWKAFLIPMSLFVACLFNAAGIYILYTGSSLGVVFVAIGLTIIATGMFLFITFQNKQRAGGKWKSPPEDRRTKNIQQLERAYPGWGTESDTKTDLTPVDPIPAIQIKSK